MKKRKTSRFDEHPAYPGAAGNRYFVGRLLETMTAIASGMGFITVLLFFLLL